MIFRRKTESISSPGRISTGISLSVSYTHLRVQTGLAPLPAPFQPIQETAPDIPQRLIGEVILRICQVNHGLQVSFSKLVHAEHADDGLDVEADKTTVL